jgi:hypothetical protein
VSGLKKDKAGKVEEISLNDLARINLEAIKFKTDLAVIGGYAARSFTQARSWRFTKDIDFITTRSSLTALRGVLELLEYARLAEARICAPHARKQTMKKYDLSLARR